MASSAVSSSFNKADSAIPHRKIEGKQNGVISAILGCECCAFLATSARCAWKTHWRVYCSQRLFARVRVSLSMHRRMPGISITTRKPRFILESIAFFHTQQTEQICCESHLLLGAVSMLSIHDEPKHLWTSAIYHIGIQLNQFLILWML